MPKRVEGASDQQEGEIRQRHLRIGLMGPVGSGKSALSQVLGESWGVTPITEDFGANPHLCDFYNVPEDNSFKSQSWFLVRKVSQLSRLKSQATEVIDPALEMDFLYAKVQHEIGWMSLSEWQTYQMLFDTQVEASQIRRPDVFLVVNAPFDILTKRIRKRGREFELQMLEQKPEYFVKLSETVRSWMWEQGGDSPVIEINSNDFDYANNQTHRQMVVSHIEDWLGYYLKKI